MGDMMTDRNVFQFFFVHKDRLPEAEMLPGTIATASSRIFILALFIVIVMLAAATARRRHMIKSVFIGAWAFFVAAEIAVTAFDSVAGNSIGMDWEHSLPLYPCSLYLFAMPFAIWGKGNARWMGSAYACTLGLVGGIVNFIYPVQLISYSFFSFRGLHTLFYHGNLIFTFLVMLMSGYFRYTGITRMRYLLFASVPTMMLSIPANLMNYSKVHSDYMYFTGAFPLLSRIFPHTPRAGITVFMYALYIFIPMLFFLPSLYMNMSRARALHD